MTAASRRNTAGAAVAAAPGAPLLLFVLVITLARGWVAAVVHLTEDEAYYRLWSASLQFGYYDHPPMIAWWIRAGTMIAGDNALGVRLLPVLSGALASLVIFDLTQRLGAGVRTAERATVWYNATLIVGLGGFLAIPDAAAVLFWILALWCVVRAQEGRPAAWWIAAGVAAGLAAISKYSALFLAPGIVIWLVWKGGWRALARPWPWVAALIAAAFFSTNLAWNAEHHWVSFIKQFGRVAPRAFAPSHLVELILVEFVLLNPIISIFAGRGVVQSLRHSGPSDGPDLSLLLAVSAPFVAYLLLHSLHARVEAHWPAPLYPGLAMLAAAAADMVVAGGGWARLRAAAAPLGLLLSLLTMLHLMLPATDIRTVADPSLAIRDWPGFAARVEAERRLHGAGWIGAIHYGTDAQLAFEHPAVPVVELMDRDRFPPTDSSWRSNLAQPGLVVDLGRRAGDMEALRGCFAQVRALGYLYRGTTAYAEFLVSQPRRDVLGRGCWPSLDAMHAESQRYRTVGFTPPPAPDADRR
jgi:4-amino-4-deoxy-L-arabinose transferase-like glycosyltransferase